MSGRSELRTIGGQENSRQGSFSDLTFGRSIGELKFVGVSLCVEGHSIIGILCVLGHGVNKKKDGECQKHYLEAMYERKRHVIHAHLH